jgi:hypothetical protein
MTDPVVTKMTPQSLEYPPPTRIHKLAHRNTGTREHVNTGKLGNWETGKLGNWKVGKLES